MNNKISVRKCAEYDLHEVYEVISDIYCKTDGPEVSGKKVLVKPNVLTDSDPARSICTHPVVVEAMVSFLQAKGATVFIGDSPSIHLKKFRPEKIGIQSICERRGVPWIDFRLNPTEKRLRNGKIKIASIVDEVDFIFSLPKFKNHELFYFTGAIKNTLGLVPGFNKGRQHALHQNRISFGEFLVDLNEAVTPHYFLMDCITGMEGPGPGNGTPKQIGLIMGSSNPLIMDIIASKIAGYDPMIISTSRTALKRKLWLSSEEEIIYDGPELGSIRIRDFRKIPVSGNANISFQFVMKRIKPLRKLERRPVFIHEKCTGCLKCVKICPVNAIAPHAARENYIILTDSKCIRCFCCSEVCPDGAVEIRRKFFGI